jgi:single-strand DNA-binding protein
VADLNKVLLIGRLGRDPEMRYVASGQAVTQMSVATSRNWKKDDEWQEETEWSRVVIWGQTGERAAEQLRKGSRVYVEGRMQTRSYDDQKSGTKKYTTEVVADRFINLDPKQGGEFQPEAPSGYEPNMRPTGAPAGGRPAAAAAPAPYDADLDDLPF